MVFTEKKYVYENESSDGKYLFKPYNLADIENIDPLKTNSVAIELNLWGKVDFITSVITGNEPYPAVYLTNEQKDIFYRFSTPFQVDT